MNLLHVYYEAQMGLNRAMMGLYPDRPVTLDRILAAMAAEVGEFLQATKSEWCWWKSLPPADEALALEEGVDVLFFALTLDLFTGALGEVEPPAPPTPSLDAARNLLLSALQLATSVVHSGYLVPVAPTVLMALYQRWSREEVFRAYQAKLEVNRKRTQEALQG